MWYQDEGEIRRAPVPKEYEKRVDELENSDNILYQSIVLAKAPRDTKAVIVDFEDARSGESSGVDIDFDDEFVLDIESSVTELPKPDEKTLNIRIRQLEVESFQLDLKIKSKGTEIADLNKQICKKEAEKSEMIRLYEETVSKIIALKEASRAKSSPGRRTPPKKGKRVSRK